MVRLIWRSRALTDEEKSQGLEENIVTNDGIAVAVNKNNTVKNVTKEQLLRSILLVKSLTGRTWW